MRIPRRVHACVCFLSLLVVAVPSAQAAWIASGTFKYQDREFDENGFTGATPLLPIRYAKVEVRYLKGGGGSTLLASGPTDANGNFSITVSDTSTRDIFVRVLTISGAADLFLQVTNILSPVVNYAVTTSTFTSHPPVNLNIGTITAAIGAGGEPFNLFDVGVNTMDYLAFLNGSRPGSTQQLTMQWQSGFGVPTSSYIGNDTIQVADISGYNDTVVQHESGHYAVDNFSASDSPGGIHHLSNCVQDLRLAFDEGFATYFGQSVRRHFNLPNPELYVKTTGAPGAGNLDFYFDVEDEVPFTCSGSSSEVTVYAALWDLGDSAATADHTPGLDEPWDSIGDQDSMIWGVMRNYIPSALNKSAEDFWDGWFNLGEGSDTSVRTVFVQHGMEFVNDVAESNDSAATATGVLGNGSVFHATYFKNVGNGAGTTDIDYFKFDTVAGVEYRIDTSHLVGDANTSLVLLGPDGTTVIASNDDGSPSDKSSHITFTPPLTTTYYVKSFHSTGLGIYGSYDFSVTGGFLAGGSDPAPWTGLHSDLRKRSSSDGQSAGGGSLSNFPE